MHRSSRIISTALCNKKSNLPSSFSGYHFGDRSLALSFRSISSTTQLDNSWMNKIKGVFTGNKTSPEEARSKVNSLVPFNDNYLLRSITRVGGYDEDATRIGAFKKYIVGRSDISISRRI